VLGIDNLVFISIITAQLPKEKQRSARRAGLMFALFTRLALLSMVFLLTRLKSVLFTVFGQGVSIRDIIMITGGLFLLYKATQEIHEEVVHNEESTQVKPYKSFFWIVLQIGILDIVFSLDSVITAIALTDEFLIMAAAITVAILVMLFLSDIIHNIIQKNPTLKMLALSFLIMIGMVLVADGFHVHIPRTYLYVTITYSLFVEFLNSKARKKRKKQKQVT